jgi:hypothetical protein
MKEADWDVLIPELKRWNNGAGIDPESWVGCEGNFQLAAAYALIFWPSFLEMDGMVFRSRMDRQTLDSWRRSCSGDPPKVEAMANHIHLIDLHHQGCPDASLERIIFLGNVLKEIYTAKLAAEFPDRRFVVDFYQPADKDLGEYQLTFYQPHEKP